MINRTTTLPPGSGRSTRRHATGNPAATPLALRNRFYNPETGRFNRLDPYSGNTGDPQSLHKYAYVHGDPVNAVDPTGQFFISLLLGFALSSSLRTSNWARAAVGLAAAVDLGLILNYAVLRRFSGALYSSGQFIPVDKAALQVHYQSVRIGGSRRSADEVFRRMQQFSRLNLYPVTAKGDVTGRDGVVTFDMFGTLNIHEFGQADFDVKVTKFDSANRTFVARTLAGHPLAGWRLWRVREAGANDLIVETFAVAHPVTGWDSVKMANGGLEGLQLTWTNMLGDLVGFSGGDVVDGADTVLGGENRSNRLEEYLRQVE
jgi:RHS repeat-associated protein